MKGDIAMLRHFLAAEADQREDACFEKSGVAWQAYVVPAQEAIKAFERVAAKAILFDALCSDAPKWQSIAMTLKEGGQ